LDKTKIELQKKKIQQQFCHRLIDHMEDIVLQLSRRLGTPKTSNEDTTFEFTTHLFSVVVNTCNEEGTIKLMYRNEMYNISVHDFEENLINKPIAEWNQLLSDSKPLEISKLEELLSNNVNVTHGKAPDQLACWIIENEQILIMNNPFGWSSVCGTKSENEFYLFIKQNELELKNASIGEVIHVLNQYIALKWKWSHETTGISSQMIWKLDFNNTKLFQLMKTCQQIEPEQLLLFEMTNAQDRWAMVIRDHNFQIWKCFIGIPLHNQSILYEQSHTVIQYLNTVDQLTLHKLTFSGKIKQKDIVREHFLTDKEFEEFEVSEPEEMWWFGFDFNHSPISHFQVFEEMKKRNFKKVPTLAEYLLENPDDFMDISPLEYSTPNWINTSLEIDKAIPNRSYKDLQTCKRVIEQVNDVLFQNEEIFLQIMRLELLANDEE
jgi:hypothetical protein